MYIVSSTRGRSRALARSFDDGCFPRFRSFGFKTSRAPRHEKVYRVDAAGSKMSRIDRGGRTFNLLRIGVVVHGVRWTSSVTMCGRPWFEVQNSTIEEEEATPKPKRFSAECLDYYDNDN